MPSRMLCKGCSKQAGMAEEHAQSYPHDLKESPEATQDFKSCLQKRPCFRKETCVERLLAQKNTSYRTTHCGWLLT